MQFGPVMALVSGSTVDNAIIDPKGSIAELVAVESDDAKLIDELFVKILNRPAEQKEIDAAMAMIAELPTEHTQLLATLQEYQLSLAPAIAEQEKKRQQSIAEAEKDLGDYETQIAAQEAELDRQHNEGIATADAKLKEYETTLGDRLAQWEAREDKTTAWTPLDPGDLSSTSATTLTKQEDLSVVATSSNGLGTYKIVANTDLKGIRAVRLEALADDRQPKKGPGRAPDGNFVLTEFELSAAPASEPSKVEQIGLENAQADFSQADYSVTTAIDGNMAASGNGWAVSPKVGETRVASFETKQDVGYDGGTVLTFLLHQQFNSGQHSLGRFRLSVTTSTGPIQLDGLPTDVTDILAIAATDRDDEQQATLLGYYRSIDGELKKLETALSTATQPRPVDPQLKQRRDKLAEVSRPLPIDLKLAQLRADAVLSEEQLKNVRLTAAQDLAWALINSPSFLFNR
jgi:flagellar motility protein MotE (MotC chaperone)